MREVVNGLMYVLSTGCQWRAIPFRTEEPFNKIVINLIAVDGSEGQKIEFLADGEQVSSLASIPTPSSLIAGRVASPGRSRSKTCPTSARRRRARRSRTWSKSLFATSVTNALQSGRNSAGLPTAPS